MSQTLSIQPIAVLNTIWSPWRLLREMKLKYDISGRVAEHEDSNDDIQNQEIMNRQEWSIAQRDISATYHGIKSVIRCINLIERCHADVTSGAGHVHHHHHHRHVACH